MPTGGSQSPSKLKLIADQPGKARCQRLNRCCCKTIIDEREINTAEAIPVLFADCILSESDQFSMKGFVDRSETLLG